MKITPDEIQQKKFKTRFRGSDAREVGAYLGQVAGVVAALSAENEKLKGENSRLSLETRGYKEREETFKRAMVSAQEVLDQMKTNARKSAELVIAKAEIKAEKILNGAHNRLSQLHEDIMDLKRQRMQLEVQIRAVLEAHGKLLEMGKAESDSADVADEKVKFLSTR